MANIMRLGGGRGKVSIIKLGSVQLWNQQGGSPTSGTRTATFNVKNIRPDDYNKLTIDNFVQTQVSFRVHYGDVTVTSGAITYSYDASSGVLTLKTAMSNGYAGSNINIDINIAIIE